MLTGSGTSFGYAVTVVRTDNGRVLAQESSRCDVCMVKEAMTEATLTVTPTIASAETSQNEQMIVVRARDGTELVSLGPSYGKWLSSDQIPLVMRDAMVSVEDRRYRSHFGIDPIGLARAGYVALTSGKGMRATSTITQQLARNLFLNNSRSYARKAREMVLAMALEVKFSKENVTSVDWETYPILDITERPHEIDVVLINRQNVPPNGAGEHAA